MYACSEEYFEGDSFFFQKTSMVHIYDELCPLDVDVIMIIIILHYQL